MIAMQYKFSLPTDYDMARIRQRIETKGPSFNSVPGLLQKSFLYAEKDINGAIQNLYAPFYIWDNAVAMKNFLLSDKFEAVVQAFGRPIVRHWQVLFWNKAGKMPTTGYGLLEKNQVPEGSSLSKFVEKEEKLQPPITNQSNQYSHVVGLDPATWEIVRFSIWRDLPPHTESGQLLSVGYIATSQI